MLRSLWAAEPCTFAGEHYRITGLDGHPKPLTPGGPPILVGGGGERVLRLAGAHADVVGVNVNLSAGVIDSRAFPDGTPDATDRKVGWVREAAGDRDPELHVRVHLAMVTDDRDGVVHELAGGFGLTLTEADYVFMLDPWWNPAAEAQAVDRAHRIGQERRVMVYRLIAAGTIEEKVMALQQRKARLFHAVMDDDALFGRALSADDIRGLFDSD